MMKKKREDLGLRITAYILSAIFAALLLFPLVYTFGNSLKDDNKIYEIPPRMFPSAIRSFSVVADYSGLGELSDNDLLIQLKADSTMALYAIPYELNKESVYEVVFWGVKDGRPIFYTRAHRNQVRLELDFGIYAKAAISRDVLMYQDRFIKSADKFGYEFDINGLNTEYNTSALNDNPYSTQVGQYLTENYGLGGRYLGTIVISNPMLALESYKHYFTLPSRMFPNIDVVQKTGYGIFFLNTVIVLVFAMLTQTFLCALTAYPLSRVFGKKLSGFLLMIFLGTMMVPFVAIMIPQYLMYKDLGFFNNYSGLLVPYLVPAASFIFLYKVFFDRIPNALFEAAIIDGASTWHCFTEICLPLSKPVMALVALTTFLNNWNNFFWAYMITDGAELWTLNVALYRLSMVRNVKQNFVMGLAFTAIIPILFITVLFSRQIKRNIAQTGIKG